MTEKKLHNVKTMICQKTELVVWLSYYQDSLSPIVDSTLMCQTFTGLTEIDLWAKYKKYELYFDHHGVYFYERSRNNFSEEQQKYYKYVRAKCIAYDFSNKVISRIYERYNFTDETIYPRLMHNPVEFDKWVPLFQEIHNCSESEARKLLKFKIDEYENAYMMLEAVRLTTFERIKQTKTIEEVATQYNILTSKLMNIGRINILTYPVITGQG